MAVLAAALEGAPVIGEGLPEQAAAPTPPAVPVMPAGIAAEFLALAALTLQGGDSAKAAGTVAQEGKEGVSETSEAKAATPSVMPVTDTIVFSEMVRLRRFARR